MQGTMTLVIDAYNMLKQRTGSSYVTQEQQRAFIDELVAYARRKKHLILLIFDGGPGFFPTRQREGPVTIVYAGQRTTADEVIKEELPQLIPHDTLLVTSDRELCAYAARYGIVSLEPSLFEYYSKQPTTGKGMRIVKDTTKPLKQEGYKSSSLVDELMEKASTVMLYKDDREVTTTLQEPAHGRLSKKDRKRVALIKKL
jgi:predicted RNA-binding protein with PIN domain